MNISRALNIFGYSSVKDIENIDEQILKRKFRVLMKKNHPDIGGNEENAKIINNSYALLLDLLRNSNLKDEHTIYEYKNKDIYEISLENLISIYTGKEIKLTNGKDTITINKSNLKKLNIIIRVEIFIDFDGKKEYIVRKFKLDSNDNYVMDIYLSDNSLTEKRNIMIKTYDKEVNVTMSGKRLEVNISFNYLANLKIKLERNEVLNG